jgi:FkbM family methyltransferase
MTDLSFLVNRYVFNRRIVNGYKYQFLPFGGGQMNEPHLESIILERGECFVDAGANVGGWSIPASKYYGQVEAFEANPKVARVMAKNSRLNHCHNIRVHACALGERASEENLYLYRRDGQDSFFPEHNGFTSSGQTIRVPIVALDSYNLRPSVIKIDTEGYELLVVKGALNTINKSKPKLVISTHVQSDVALIEKMFQTYRWTSIGELGLQTLIGEPD